MAFRQDCVSPGGRAHGEVAERSNAADCKSVALAASEVRILPSPPTFVRFASDGWRASKRVNELGWQASEHVSEGAWRWDRASVWGTRRSERR